MRAEGFGEPASISSKQYFELWQQKIQSPEVFNTFLRQHSEGSFNSDDVDGANSLGS